MKAFLTRGCCSSLRFHDRWRGRRGEEAPRPLGAGWVAAHPAEPGAVRTRLGPELAEEVRSRARTSHLQVPGGGQRLTQPRVPPFDKRLDFPPACANIPATQVTHKFITSQETLMSVSLADCAGRCCSSHHVLCTKSFCLQLQTALTRAWT